MASIDWTMLDDNRDPVPLPGEESVMDIDHGVEMTLLIPDSRPSGGIGGSGERLRETGKLWLTDKRLIFQTTKTSKNLTPSFNTFSVLLHGILSTQFVQPTFAANYLIMDLKPAPGGGLGDGSKCELRFKDQPMLPFINVLDKSRERAVYRRRDAMFEDDLPTYSSSATPQPGESASPPAVSSTQATEPPPGYDA